MNRFNFIAVLAAAGAALLLAPAHVAAQAAAKPISMGMQLRQTPERPEVLAVFPERTGAAIGFKVGDIVLEAGGKPISPEVAQAYLKDKKEGDELIFKVERGGEVMELRGKGMAAPQGAPAPAAQPAG